MGSFPSFPEFYQQVHDHLPFQWQVRLAEEVWESKTWPEHISAPTGAGKTSTLDIAVWLLARDVAENGIEGRHFPLRTFLTVERRLVVDGAAKHADEIAESIESDPALTAIKSALQKLLPGSYSGPVLQVTSLHGGKTIVRDWLRPFGAQIITATVTQLASRTLFRGVSVSPGTLPVHAGLTGMDRLILVDEPHLAPAAVSMWRATEQIQRAYPHFHLVGSTVVLGATVPDYLSSENRFIGSLDGDPSKAAQKRQSTVKPARIVEVDSSTKAIKIFIDAAKEAFEDRSREKDSNGILVVVNTVATAVKVATGLRTALKKYKEARIPLLTSTVRPIDRDTLDKFTPDTVIVATQTVEVGVDIDAEVLITELPAMPALIQRFGRVNRRGELKGEHATKVSTVVAPVDKQGLFDKATAYIYGEEQLSATWKSLIEHADESRIIADVNALTVPTEAWEPSPRICDVKDFLPRLTITRPPAQAPWEALAFGPDHTDRASVTLAWRETLDGILDRTTVFSQETISIPIAQARAFLTGEQREPDFADTIAESRESQTRVLIKVNCRIREGEKWVQPQFISQIHPGDLIIISTDAGGYSPETGFSAKLSAPVTDQSMKIAVTEHRGFFDMNLLNTPRSKEEGPQLDPLLVAEEFGMNPVDIVTDRLSALFLAEKWSERHVIVDGRLVGVRVINNNNLPIPSRVNLASHSIQTSELAAEYARLMGLSTELVEAESLAGLLHDAGKVDQKFQLSFHNYLPEPVAKPVGSTPPSRLDRGQVAWRHEILSASAVTGNSEADELVRHLIITHHGWGRRLSPHEGITQFNSKRYRNLENQYGPWGLALLETILRTADWEASRVPLVKDNQEDTRLDTKWEELNISVDPETAHPNVATETTHVLTGPRPYSLTMLFAGIGALASCVHAGDPNARMRVIDGIVEISSTTSPSWDTNTFNRISQAIEIGSGHKKLDGTPGDNKAPDFFRDGSKWYLSHRAFALQRSPESSPLFFDASTDNGSNRHFSVPIHLRNGNPFKILATKNGQLRTQALFDPEIGFVIGKMTGGLDTGADDRFAGATDRRYSEDQLAWAIAGMISLGMPATDAGIGVKDRKLTLPISNRWNSFDEICDMGLSPISTVETLKWRSQSSRQSEQLKLWEPDTDG